MVLIIALVSIALLGFSFGASGDVSLTQSQAYWKGTEPLSIGEDSGAYFYVIGSDPDPYEIFYFRIRNSGSYPLRLTKMFGGGSGDLHLLERGGHCRQHDFHLYLSWEGNVLR